MAVIFFDRPNGVEDFPASGAVFGQLERLRLIGRASGQ